ncbi:MAG: hypothetical protein ACOZCO_10585 [Bacteroidota bacterium]
MENIKPFDERKMKLLHDYLKRCAADGRPRYYEIRLDEFRAVPRTNDPASFEHYKESLDEKSQLVKVFIYNTHPRSFNAEKHFFKIQGQQEDEKVAVPSLSGYDVDAKIQAAVERERERIEHEKLCEELDKTKADLKEAEDYIQKLKEDLKKYEGKKLHWGNVNLGELASVVMEGMIRRNPQLLTKLPGGEALAGIIEEDNKEREKRGETTVDAEVTFEKNEKGNPANLSEDQQKFLQVLGMLEENFNEGELALINAVLERLLHKPQDLKIIASLLNISKH